MKIVILTCSTGEGHNSAANALDEFFKLQNIDSRVIDTLSLISASAPHKASNIYLFTTRTQMFKYLYEAGEVVRHINLQSPVYLANKLYCGKLLHYIKGNSIDTVICTHLFPAEAITALKRTSKLTEKTVFIMTDYTCIPFMEETELDYYIIPHEHLIEECANKGIPRIKMYPYGIPVKHQFHTHQPQEETKDFCNSYFQTSLHKNKYWLTIMSGSMGYGNVKSLVENIISRYNSKFEVIIVCGNNSELKDTLTQEFQSCNNITVLGFTDQVSKLMDASDVLFTKPGGLSSTEAAAKNIPIIHTAPIPGCETRNAEFFHYHGMSYSSTNIDIQVDKALQLCEDKTYRERMILCQKMNINTNTCQDILTLISNSSK